MLPFHRDVQLSKQDVEKMIGSLDFCRRAGGILEQANFYASLERMHDPCVECAGCQEIDTGSCQVQYKGFILPFCR